jgi:uncharacterized LabA/DUF88 family protein
MASPDDERIALFLDYENLAIGAREALGGLAFDFRPIADALAERGRVVSRKAYADWSYFDDDRRMLTRNHVELVEIPQRMGTVRKNAADIKMAVDAMEVAFEREYLTTFVICTGDSDFTPLVYKLRELNKRVIGVGIKASTSKLLPPACDEFLFYENLEGVEYRDRDTGDTKDEPAPADEERSGDQDEIQRLIATTVANPGKPWVRQHTQCVPQPTVRRRSGATTDEPWAPSYRHGVLNPGFARPPEGQGFQQQMNQFVVERMWSTYSVAASMERALQRTRDYLQERIVFGKPLMKNQYLQYRLSELAAEVDMMKVYNYSIAGAHSRGEDVTRMATIAKWKSGRLSREVADWCLQFHGGIGYIEETWTTRFMRDTRLQAIGAGSDETMLQVLARIDGYWM